MSIQIKSYNQILGEMVRKVIADTPLNDVNVGSALLSLLEAAAQIDFENSASILNVLELLSIDAIRNNDLDARASDFGLSRIPARRSTGYVTISDSSITKRSTGLYQIKPAPIAGSTTIYVNNAADWASTGNLYIGRGTASFEGPIPYTSITDNGSFYAIELGSALQKDHLISDVIVDAQGTVDRIVTAGTSINIPANNQNPIVEYQILRDAVIPAGEDTVENIEIIAIAAGSKGNAGINTISAFTAVPFVGATVTNPIPLTNGRDVESDPDLRERLKSYANTLARGTSEAILNAIIGISDPDDSKQVASAIVKEPANSGDPSIIYIDDGSGFQPTFVGQSVDKMISNASGKEEFLQLANYPLPRPQVINTIEGPFELEDGMILNVIVDDEEESIVFSSSHFDNISAARISEVIIAINDQSTNFKATFTDNSRYMLLYPLAHDAEIIQVSTLRDSDDEDLYANGILKFPTNEFSYIRLYQNNTLLSEKEKTATLTTKTFDSWSINASGNIIISVDGTPAQDRSFATSDFDGAAFSTLSLEDWVEVFNQKFAGLTAVATSSERMQISSNKVGSESSIEILGGSYLGNWFEDDNLEAVGQNSDFQLNRQTGNLRILTDINPGDTISAGIEDAKGSVTSTATSSGNFNVSDDSNGRPSELILVSDADEMIPRVALDLGIGDTITITDEGSNVMRIMVDSLTAFAAVQPYDFVYIANRTSWISETNTGLYKVIAKGGHTTADTDTYIEVKNVVITDESVAVADTDDIQVFAASSYPQIWKSSFVDTPSSVAIQDLVDSINENTINIKASIFKTDKVKLTSTTEEDGNFGTPVSSGRLSQIFTSQGEKQTGNASHIANRTSDKDAAAFFKRTAPTSTAAEGTPSKQVWLDRVQYTDIKGTLTANATIGEEGTDTYSENLQSTGNLTSANIDYDDLYNATSGSNKYHYRSIRDKLSGDRIGTQYELPYTVMNYASGDAFNIMRPLGISPEDSIIFILDKDSSAKTIDIPMARTGLVNSSFPATNLSFSATDADNESGITFGTLPVWGKTANNTEFENYAVWMKARNWYASGGVGSGGGSFLVRAKEYGPHGENIRFSLEYPSASNLDSTILHENTPDYTWAKYYFGSGDPIDTGIESGDTIQVAVGDAGEANYIFTGSNIDFSGLSVGDIVSISTNSGVSEQNSGTFRIKEIIDSTSFKVNNIHGAETSSPDHEETEIETIADVVGTSTASTITNISTGVALDLKAFKLTDSAGSVGVVYRKSTTTPPVSTLNAMFNRYIEVIITGSEDANTIAAMTAGYISADPEFSATSVNDDVFITNTEHGAYAIAVDPTPSGSVLASGFTFGGTVGTADVSLDGKYFTLATPDDEVVVWFNVSGSTQEPIYVSSANSWRFFQISTIAAGDSANTIAGKIATALNTEGTFTTSYSSGNTFTTFCVEGGAILNFADNDAGTSGFTVTTTFEGDMGTNEVISDPNAITFYPIEGTAVSDIVAKINESLIVEAAEVDGTNDIMLSTQDEEYEPADFDFLNFPSVMSDDYSESLAFGHDSNAIDDILHITPYIRLYDGINWVKAFQNSSPHFTLKKEMTLQGIAPSVYNIVDAPNADSDELGEYFKLVPITLNNVYHHFTQKALSQLPIVADIDISNNMRRIQVKSKLLGSEGAVEVVGGNANNIEFSVAGDAEVTSGNSQNFLEAKVSAFPVTLTSGDVVKIENTLSGTRNTRLSDSDTISVAEVSGDNVEYFWNPKTTNLNRFVKITITDVSTSYGRSANTVWRWTHNDAGSTFTVTGLVNGSATAPSDFIADGSGGSSILDRVTISSGSVSAPVSFQLTVNATPTQAHYFTFATTGGTTFAVWFDVNNAGTVPTGATYVSATNKIEVDITSSDTPDEVVSKLATKLLATASFTSNFSGVQNNGATLEDVAVGDILHAYSIDSTWSHANAALTNGDGQVAGFPIINVNSDSSYVDVVNPLGKAMSATLIGSGTVQICPTPIIQWNLAHICSVPVVQAVLSGGTITVTTADPHGLAEGDAFDLSDNAFDQSGTVVSVTSSTTFTFADGEANTPGTALNGFILKDGATPTKYKIESLGFNDLYRLSYVSGNAPRFVDFGVAVDDIMILSGDTFNSGNHGTFRVLGVDNTSIVYENSSATEELDTTVPFNNLENTVTWTANSVNVTGDAGSFVNIVAGMWVKKPEDSNDKYVQVLQTLDGSDVSASGEDIVKLVLGSAYAGATSDSQGIAIDFTTDVGDGVELKSVSDITFLEGDSVRVGDTLFIDRIADDNWFSEQNSGSFSIIEYGTQGDDYRPFVRVSNSNSSNQTNIDIGVSTQGFLIIEGEDNLYSSIRVIDHCAIDDMNENRRVLYMTPATQAGKVSQTNGSKIIPLGKLGYSTEVVTGVDGYSYYTGLMRTVQRTIDGFEPDPVSYPGRRAIGGTIELLPPLIKRVNLTIDVTTDEGVNLNEITNDIRSTIIDHIDSLGVGEDLILSEIIVKTMAVTGVAAVTFTDPTPSTERISVADNEKAFAEPSDINIS